MIPFLSIRRFMLLWATFKAIFDHINILTRSSFCLIIFILRAQLRLGKKIPLRVPIVLLSKITLIHDLLTQLPLNRILRKMEAAATTAPIFFRRNIFCHILNTIGKRGARVRLWPPFFARTFGQNNWLSDADGAVGIFTSLFSIHFFLDNFFFNLLVYFFAEGTTVYSVPGFWSLVYEFESDVVC